MREVSLDNRQLNIFFEAMLVRRESFRFVVTGSSMLPFIRTGDTLTVTPVVKYSKLRVGDVIVYQSTDKRLFVHRIVSKKKKNGQIQLYTRGDATFGYKEKIKEEQLLGRVVSIHRKAKHLNLAHPYHRIMALLWITGSPVTSFTLHLAKKVKSLVS